MRTNSQSTKNTNWKKNTILFLTSQSISLFGSSIVQYAIIWYITLTTGSGIMMTISTLCGFLPQILISIFAGVWADRYNKKFLIMVSDSCIAISTLVVAIFFLSGFDSIWLLFVGLAIRSLGSGVQSPTVNAMIPQIVPEKHFMRVNALNATFQSLIMIASPAISAILMNTMSIGNIFFVDVITAIIGVLVFSFIKVSHTSNFNKGEKINYFSDFKDGLVYIKNNKFIRTFLMFFALLYLGCAPLCFLSPLLVTRSYGEEVWRLTANEILFFVGTIVGGGIMSSWGGFKNKIYTIILSCLSFGVCSIVMGSGFNFIVYLIFMAISGIGMAFMGSPSTVVLQESVEESMQGRVFAIDQILASGIMPLSMLIYGPLADKFSVEALLIFTGIAGLILTVAMFMNKTLVKGYKIPEKSN